ncbi:MAG: four helix bundle protein [Flavobacteriia bacterium]|nr:four helix bundle protein [Flavobacteriia bacterium]
MALIRKYKDLIVYQKAFKVAMDIFILSRTFPIEERYSLTDQIRRSSRSVCGNLVEAWRKRRYEKMFVSKIVDSEGEASETQNWLDFAYACGYMELSDYNKLTSDYEEVLMMLAKMSIDSKKWTFNPKEK